MQTNLGLRQKTRHHRSGFTLIELMVVITMVTAVMSLTGMTFYLLMRTEKSVAQSFVTERSISRLATQFRDDVHESASGQVIDVTADSPQELILSGPKAVRVRYRQTKQGLVRLLVDNDKVTARDDYHLPDCQIHFEASSDSDGNSQTLVIDRPGVTIAKSPHASQSRKALRIRASLNRRQPIESQEPASPPKNENDRQEDLK